MSQTVQPPEAASPEGVADPAVLREQVALLYAHLPVSLSVTAVNAALLAFVQAPVAGIVQTMLWLVVLAAVTGWRGWLGVRFARRAPSDDPLRWRRPFAAAALASGLAWGASALLVYPAGSVVHQVFVAFTVGGMVAGSITVLTPLLWVFITFALVALLPVVARFAMGGDAIHYAMAIMTGVFLAAMVIIGTRVHRTVVQSLRLRFENRELVADLTREKAELRRLNESLEARVRERTAELQEVDRRRHEFLAMLSHELRNPLAPIRSSIDLLARLHLDDAAARLAVGVMDRQASHVSRLVDDLMEMTRITRGKIRLRMSDVDLARVVACAVEDQRALFREAGVQVEARLPANPVPARVDEIRISQVLGNLLQNALKFTPRGGRVEVTLHNAAGAAEIEVSDNGQGIEPGLMPLLFQPFTQGASAPSSGIGLGLALVRSIVELHGGSVMASSAGVGRGSMFVVRLPLEGLRDADGDRESEQAQA